MPMIRRSNSDHRYETNQSLFDRIGDGLNFIPGLSKGPPQPLSNKERKRRTKKNKQAKRARKKNRRR